MFEQIAEVLRKYDRFIISTHVNPEGDAIGSSMALKHILEQMGKTAWVINPDSTPEKFRFLDPDNSILVYDAEAHASFFQNAQVHCTVDVSEPKRMGSVAEPVLASSLVKVLIDHHPAQNHHADWGVIQADAAAAGVLVYELMLTLGLKLTHTLARLLYVAIMTDTGGFRFSNTNSRVHEIAAELIRAGADPQELYSLVYERDSLARFRLFQKVLLTAQFAQENQIAWMICPRSFFEQTGTTNTDLEDFVNFPRCLKEVEVSILFSEPEPRKIRISLRSRTQVAVNRLAARFGGGGHDRAAGIVMETSLEEAQAQVIAAAREFLAMAKA